VAQTLIPKQTVGSITALREREREQNQVIYYHRLLIPFNHMQGMIFDVDIP
jgi:hypothetical protein